MVPMFVEPDFVSLVEHVIAGESAFQPGQRRGPDAEELLPRLWRRTRNAPASGVLSSVGISAALLWPTIKHSGQPPRCSGGYNRGQNIAPTTP